MRIPTCLLHDGLETRHSSKPAECRSRFARHLRNAIVAASDKCKAKPADDLRAAAAFFGLLADRERADAIAATRRVPEAASLAWDRAIARDLDRAATFKLDTLEAGPELTRRRQVLAERSTEHRVPDLRDQAATLRRNADLAALGTAIRQARHISPDPKNPAALAIQGAANLAGPELAAITRLADRYKAACRTMLTAEFKSRDPSAAAAWERANQRSVERDRGPSLGR